MKMLEDIWEKVPVLQLVLFAPLSLGLGKCTSHTCILTESWPREEQVQNDPWTRG